MKLVLLIITFISMQAFASSENWVTLGNNASEGCSLNGVFAQRNDLDLDISEVRYIKDILTIEHKLNEAEVFVDRLPMEDSIYLTLNFKVIENEKIKTCVQSKFPDSNIEPFSPVAIDLKFFTDYPNFKVDINGEESISLFTGEQWVGIRIHGHMLIDFVKRSPDDFLVHILKGSILWRLGNGESISQAFKLSERSEFLLRTIIWGIAGNEETSLSMGN